MEELSLENPFEPENAKAVSVEGSPEQLYEKMLTRGEELLKKPLQGGGESRVRVQHSKGRMTVWERIKILTSAEPHITFQNWGSQLDGAGIVTGILNIGCHHFVLHEKKNTQKSFSSLSMQALNKKINITCTCT